ncbi:uncharacterized protein LOC105184583 [Harpegnathos saltator]|uniref:uncharacterized protein LOC105184583 n=1 Tax=Harpegnathos saltator TaxID=610380 RepID=UPI000DBEF02C|nr:uncharacterized protein LOC105184583 [Harpegnathos saltator]XP_025163540.1 uncharacterized protein LOC105184583 [Harpegnathos saltator]
MCTVVQRATFFLVAQGKSSWIPPPFWEKNMPKRCEIVSCPSAVEEEKQYKKHLFEFPRIGSIAAKWIKASGKINWIPNKASAVCEIHFKPEYFNNTKIRKRLKPDAVLTEHLPFSCMTDETNEIIFTEDSGDIYRVCGQLQEIEETEYIATEMEVTQNMNIDIQNVTSILEIETKKALLNESRKQKVSEELENLKIKMQEMEEENKRLKADMEWSREQHEKELKSQADILRNIYEKKKKKYQEKLVTKDKQIKTLKIQVTRKNSKLKDMLMIEKYECIK